MSVFACRVCNSPQVKVHSCKEFMFNTHAVFDYIECLDCESLVIKEIPSDMTSYYSNSYYSMQLLAPEVVNRKGFTRLTEKFGKELAASKVDKQFEYRVVAAMKPNLNDKICDVGCGSGHLIYHMKNLGFKNVTGIDPFLEKDVTYSNGLVIKKLHLRDVKEKYDLIMFNHSLEHVEDPAELLRLAKGKLTDKGKILVRIPIVGYCWNVYGKYWFGLDAPRHFYLYSVKGFSHLATQLGLKIQKTHFDCSIAHIVSSEMYKRRDLGIPEKVYPWWLKRIAKKWQHFKYQIVVNELNKQGFSDQAGFVLEAN